MPPNHRHSLRRRRQRPALGKLLFLALALWSAAAGSSAAAVRLTFRTDPEYLIDTWETEDGLPENSATAMVQTPDGYLWFGTFGGLVRFDGVKFTVFQPRNTPQLPSGGIVNLHLDRRGALWASTYDGMVRYDGRAWRAFGKQDGWGGDFARSFAERDDGALLISTFGGQVLEFSNEKFRRLPDPSGERGQGYFAHADEQGRWWVAQNAFVGLLEGGAWVSKLSVSNVSRDAVASAPARDGGTWLLLGTELNKLRDGAVHSRIVLPERPGGVWSMMEDRQTNLWIATHDRGVCRVTPSGGLRRWSTTNGLPFHATRFVFEDREENVWIGTSGGGLVRFKPRRARTIGAESGLPERIVHSVASSASRGIWIGTYGQGLFCWQDGELRKFAASDGTPVGSYLQSVHEDRAGRLWLGQFGEGLQVFDSQGARARPSGRLGGGNVISIFEDSRGVIWLGDGQGVTVCESNTFRVLAADYGLPNGGVRCFAEDSKGVVWLSNLRGVFRWNGERFVELLDPDAKPLRDINCLKAGANGVMWLGSSVAGLLRWHQETLDRIDGAAGFPAASVHGLVEDERGFFWIASNLGVVRASRAELEAVAEGAAAWVACQLVDVSDGLASRECTSGRQPVVARDDRGRVWFATLKGAAVIDPLAFRLNTNVPDVHIEQVVYRARSRSSTGGERGQSRADGEVETRLSAPFAEPLRLPPGSRRIEIHYTATTFSAPERAGFQTRLEGSSGDWEDVGNRRMAAFYEQPPGDYVFRVRAANGDGAWNENGTSLAFAVQPFYWQTVWFRTALMLLMTASGGGAVWLWARARLRRALERERAARELQESRERMDLAADAAMLGMWVSDLPHEQLWATDKFKSLYGYAPEAALSYEAILARVHPDDREATERAVVGALHGETRFDNSHRILLPDGTTRWMATSGRVERDATGRPARLLGVSIDITERMQAEHAAREVSGRLITAQEDERKRIARDLHDDLNQRLALLSVEMDLLGRETDGDRDVSRRHIEKIAGRVREMSSEVHRLSYQLHPAKLDQLGLVSAARSFCREISAQAGLPVEFIHNEVPRELDAEAALCLFRVIQESLQNVVKHSRATSARVELRAAENKLRLVVSDNGRGFDLSHALHESGLGLVGMRERARLAHGKILMHSASGQGTRVELTVPLNTGAPLA